MYKHFSYLVASLICIAFSQGVKAGVCNGAGPRFDTDLEEYVQTGKYPGYNMDDKIRETENQIRWTKERRATETQASNFSEWERATALAECQLNALKGAKQRYEQSHQVAQKTPGNSKSTDTNDLVYFSPVTAQCVRRGTDDQGRPTYTNTCNTTIMAGWCYLEQTTGNLGLCIARDSTFSRTGKNYVAQDGGWAPGTSHTVAISKSGTQFTFLVACKNGFPLIESFDSQTITRSSKARMICWRSKSGKK